MPTFLDIETIPDLNIYTPPAPDRDGKTPFPPIAAHKVVAIGWIHGPSRVLPTVATDAFTGGVFTGPEIEVLTEFHRGFNQQQEIQIVTWNGRRFDIPVLAMRALRYNISTAWIERNKMRYRYDDAHHCDLADQLSDYGAAMMPSLDLVAKLCGLPGKIDGAHGSEVDKLFLAGKVREIAEYCLTDVFQTAVIYYRRRVAKGVTSADEYQRAFDLLCQCLRDYGCREFLSHLQSSPFPAPEPDR